jgi:hypothetical protein
MGPGLRYCDSLFEKLGCICKIRLNGEKGKGGDSGWSKSCLKTWQRSTDYFSFRLSITTRRLPQGDLYDPTNRIVEAYEQIEGSSSAILQA